MENDTGSRIAASRSRKGEDSSLVSHGPPFDASVSRNDGSPTKGRDGIAGARQKLRCVFVVA
jgi:hypothetical protein